MSMIDRETLYALWVLHTAGQCSSRTYKAMRYFSSFEEIFRASPLDYPREFFTPAERAAFSCKDLEPAGKTLRYCEEQGISVVHYYHPAYPPLLREIYRPPLVLFVKGRLPDPSLPSIAVVGSRKCSEHGRQFAAKFAYQTALCGGVVVSGIADGIDQYAHKGAHLAGKPSIAVLPCGVDVLYAESCRELYAYTERYGALISEYLPKTKARKTHFEARNRIISALSQAVVVVEAGERSGAFLTVNHAIEQNKQVFAVPGSPDSPYSKGTNLLLSEGAMICTDARSVLSSLGSVFQQKLTPLETVKKQQAEEKKKKAAKEKEAHWETLSEPERAFCSFFGSEPLSVDELCMKSGRPFGEVLSLLRSLETAEVLESVYGGYYQIKNDHSD